jgi:hypothetical protein
LPNEATRYRKHRRVRRIESHRRQERESTGHESGTGSQRHRRSGSIEHHGEATGQTRAAGRGEARAQGGRGGRVPGQRSENSCRLDDADHAEEGQRRGRRKCGAHCAVSWDEREVHRHVDTQRADTVVQLEALASRELQDHRRAPRHRDHELTEREHDQQPLTLHERRTEEGQELRREQDEHGEDRESGR